MKTARNQAYFQQVMTIPKDCKTYFPPYHEMAFHLWQDSDTRPICRKNGLRMFDFSGSSSVLDTGEAWRRYLLKREAAQ